VPLVDGRPWTMSQTDMERLVAGELVYMGVGRTPICAVTRTFLWRGHDCPVAAELFATTADAYVLLGELPEQSDPIWTADGRPLNKEFARERLARMVCADATKFSDRDAVLAAEKVREMQTNELRRAASRLISRMPQPPGVLVTSGSGEFLAKRAVDEPADCRTVSLESLLGREASSAAAAQSVAVLARQRGEKS
jgi:probable H4MPT-linked C1 transfer pathway protein